jgi:hypothetical protein
MACKEAGIKFKRKLARLFEEDDESKIRGKISSSNFVESKKLKMIAD